MVVSCMVFVVVVCFCFCVVVDFFLNSFWVLFNIKP